MEELVKLVSENVGIDEAKAEKAVETVMAFLKEKLPAPLAERLDDIAAGAGNIDASKLGDLTKGLGGLFGGKK